MSRTFEIVTELSKISIVGSLKSSVKVKSNLLCFLMSSSSFYYSVIIVTISSLDTFFYCSLGKDGG